MMGRYPCVFAMSHHARFMTTTLALAIACASGCALFDPATWGKSTPETGPDAVKPAKAEPVTTQEAANASPGQEGSPRTLVSQEDTIGSVAYLRYNRTMQVRGYGLVIGLDGAGSGKCPQSIADYLQTEIQRFQSTGSGELGKIPPKELIKSPHTAAVLVEGQIPSAATRGTLFDVSVRAVDKDVKSIAGGVLITCNLRLFSADAPLEGKILARAGGRVFANPFAKSGGDTDPRSGRVLGGGSALEDRPIQIITTSPSYATVRQMTRILNDRMGTQEPVADAVSPTNVTLKVPPAFRRREERYLEIVTHMPLAGDAISTQARSKALCEELAQSSAPYDDTALCLEAIGPSVIPMLQKLYTHRQRTTNFYSARTGARLGDGMAIEVLQRHAKEVNGTFRQAAIRELGDAATFHRLPGAASVLRVLLDDNDTRIRIAAYEALRSHRDAAVQSRMIGHDNFILELVDSKGPGLIYARRTRERRIAIFGRFLKCQAPVFYSQPDRPITIADDGDKVVIVRRSRTGRGFQPARMSFDVADLISGIGAETTPDTDGRIPGVGADYAAALHAISTLCGSGAIPATFRMEEADISDILGPQEPQLRPESDEL